MKKYLLLLLSISLALVVVSCGDDEEENVRFGNYEDGVEYSPSKDADTGLAVDKAAVPLQVPDMLKLYLSMERRSLYKPLFPSIQDAAPGK